MIVCGCGESASTLSPLPGILTIGVNDFSRKFHPDYLVVVNDKASFEEDRWYWIEHSRSPYVFTHLKNLQVGDERRVLISLGRYGGTELDLPTVPYTSNSPYVATAIAHHLGATKIGLIGVDFTLNHFFAETGEHVLTKRIGIMSQEYKQLRASLASKGVEFYNLSSTSKIDIPKMSIEDFVNL